MTFFKQYRYTIVMVAFIVATVLFSVVSFVRWHHAKESCENKGGVYVKSYGGHGACINKKEIIK